MTCADTLESEIVSEHSPQLVVCAAIRHSNGSIICGPRHFDQTMRAVICERSEDWRRAEQGFVDQFGTFLTREEACKIAWARGQIDHTHTGGLLFSEDLY